MMEHYIVWNIGNLFESSFNPLHIHGINLTPLAIANIYLEQIKNIDCVIVVSLLLPSPTTRSFWYFRHTFDNLQVISDSELARGISS